MSIVLCEKVKEKNRCRSRNLLCDIAMKPSKRVPQQYHISFETERTNYPLCCGPSCTTMIHVYHMVTFKMNFNCSACDLNVHCVDCRRTNQAKHRSIDPEPDTFCAKETNNQTETTTYLHRRISYNLLLLAGGCETNTNITHTHARISQTSGRTRNENM